VCVSCLVVSEEVGSPKRSCAVDPSPSDDCPDDDDDTPAPPEGGDDPCGLGCWDPPELDDPFDPPGFMSVQSWQTTSSGMAVAVYQPASADCPGDDPQNPCEGEDPPEYCVHAGSCHDADIQNNEHRELILAAEEQGTFVALAEASNWDAAWQGNRVERVGIIRPGPFGEGLNAYPLPSTAYKRESTPIRAWPYKGMIPDDAIAFIHTQPFEVGEFIDWGNLNFFYRPKISQYDSDGISELEIEYGIMIDRDGITVFKEESGSYGDERYNRCEF